MSPRWAIQDGTLVQREGGSLVVVDFSRRGGEGWGRGNYSIFVTVLYRTHVPSCVSLPSHRRILGRDTRRIREGREGGKEG